MAADEAAARGHRRDDLAAALVSLAGADPRPAALTAGAPAAMAHLQRLLTPPEQHCTGPPGWPPSLGGHRLRSTDHRSV